jgi:hypothetical protein
MKEKKSAFSAREAIRVGLHLTVVAIFCHGLAQIFTDFKTQSVKIREISGWFFGFGRLHSLLLCYRDQCPNQVFSLLPIKSIEELQDNAVHFSINKQRR